MEDIKCPRCGKILIWEPTDRHYWYCWRGIDTPGCNTVYGKTLDYYFTGLYILNECGEIIAYKADGGKIIRTNKFLPEHWGRKMNSFDKEYPAPDWGDLLPEGLKHMSVIEREKELIRMMEELPKGSQQRNALKIFLNSRYGGFVK